MNMKEIPGWVMARIAENTPYNEELQYVWMVDSETAHVVMKCSHTNCVYCYTLKQSVEYTWVRDK